MCGIIGQINFNQQPVDQLHFNAMRDTMVHRGPDGFGTQLINHQTVALGHRRLSIIDLSESGKQPMCNETGTLWLTFNGEIYNYKDLKQQLQAKGHVFKSQTDSEVLLHGFEEWGMEDLLNRLKGMFAFAIYDDKTKMLWAARDRFGIKPFYYYFDQQRLIFASEIKAIAASNQIEKEINHQALADFFIYSYVPNPNTIWKNIHKLPPAHCFSLNASNPIPNVKQYWQLQTNNLVIPDKEAIEKTYELIQQATQQHLVSDVPVGLFLSGGYDSTTLLMHASKLGIKLNTYSIGFDKSKKSEHHVARKLSSRFGGIHHEQIIENNIDWLKFIKELSYFYDEPYAISSMIPYYLVSKLASENSKVVLAGDGGDEAFAGYVWHNYISGYSIKTTIKDKLRDLIKGKVNRELWSYNNFMTGVSDELLLNDFLDNDLNSNIRRRNFWLYKKYYKNELSGVKRWQYLDVHTFIPEPCLTRSDRSSMANSIEARVPFLDHEIFEFTFSLNQNVYFKPNQKKYLIRKNLENNIESEILNLPKQGFSFQNIGQIFNANYFNIIENGKMVKLGIIKKNALFKLPSFSPSLKFHLLMLEIWFEQNT